MNKLLNEMFEEIDDEKRRRPTRRALKRPVRRRRRKRRRRPKRPIRRRRRPLIRPLIIRPRIHGVRIPDEPKIVLSSRTRRAIRKNRRLAILLNWKKYLYRIIKLLGHRQLTTSERTFARSVADWQSDHDLTRTGYINRRTWEKMRVALGLEHPENDI